MNRNARKHALNLVAARDHDRAGNGEPGSAIIYRRLLVESIGTGHYSKGCRNRAPSALFRTPTGHLALCERAVAKWIAWAEMECVARA